MILFFDFLFVLISFSIYTSTNTHGMMGCNIGSLINETSSNQNKQQNSDSIEIKRNDSKQSILTIYSSTMPPITTNSITKKKQQQIIKLQPKSLRKLSGKKQQQQQQQPKQRSSSKSLTILKLPICLLTLKERTQLCNGFVPIQSSTKLLLSAPFSNFNQYTRRLFLTGFAGIIPENLNQYRIGYIIILAKEMQSIIPITKDRSTISAEMHKFLVKISILFTFQIFSNQLNFFICKCRYRKI